MAMTYIYVAAPWKNRDQARDAAQALLRDGHRITSRWLSDGHDLVDIQWRSPQCVREARMDLADVRDASTVLVLTTSEPIGVGHHVEFGYALATGKVVVVAGPLRSVFHPLANFWYPTWAEAWDRRNEWTR